MAKTLVLTFIAEDRSGLVETLSETVAEQGGNWLESRMAHLAEKFAGIARVEVPGDKVSSLKTALMGLGAEGFHLAVEEAAVEASLGGPVFNLDLVGPDQPGILRDISRCLTGLGVSVEEMATDVRGAPMGGGNLFYAKARVCVPPGLSEEELRRALEAIAGALMVDIALREEVAT
ncbi:MAG: glycine cleavage system protein R [Alphaproteobacteria bacterium]|nr:glycine cleavage system protein R [Alphaproteobacteria bacterium]